MTLLASFLLLGLASGPALAQDEGGSSSGSIDDLLGSIPDIEGSEPEEEEAKPPPELTFPQYTRAVNKVLLENWTPKKKALKDPKAEVQFTIKVDANGQVTEVRPVKLSGNKHLDQSALDVFNSLDAVPAPPPGLAGSAGEGILVRFPVVYAIKMAG